MKYTLKRPIRLTDASPEISELVFREEVVAGDLRGIRQSALATDPLIDDVLKIAGRLCGQPDAVMNKLSVYDTGEVMALVHDFFKRGLETGTKP